jgi:hypothetical protein
MLENEQIWAVLKNHLVKIGQITLFTNYADSKLLQLTLKSALDKIILYQLLITFIFVAS